MTCEAISSQTTQRSNTAPTGMTDAEGTAAVGLEQKIDEQLAQRTAAPEPTDAAGAPEPEKMVEWMVGIKADLACRMPLYKSDWACSSMAKVRQLPDSLHAP